MVNKSISKNYKELKKSQKGGYGVPLYTRYINRKLGQLLASVLAKWKVSPNAISLISGFFTFGAYITFLFLSNITFLYSLGLYLSLVIGFALDSADGLVSRLLQKQSLRGEWLDHALDAIKIPLGHGVIFILIIDRIQIDVAYQFIMLSVLVLASSSFLSNILKDKLKIIQNLKLAVDSNKNRYSMSSNSFFRSLITLPFDYGIFMMFFLLSSFQDLFFKVYFIWGCFFLLYHIAATFKAYFELYKFEKDITKEI